jgi:hypothetical protein
LTLCVLLCPIVTVPKLSDAGDIAKPACMPVPLKGIVAGEPGALLVMEILPDPAPSVVGAN